MTAKCLLLSSVLLLPLTPVAIAQTAPATDTPAYVPTMTFDVASVRVSNQDPNLPHRTGGFFRPHSTSISMENVGLYWVVTLAYGVDLRNVQGLPNWGPTTFNIEAKSDADADAKMASLTDEQQRAEQEHMLQALLADRFHFKAHWETVEKPTYHLVIAKSGSKLLAAGSMPRDTAGEFPERQTDMTLHQQRDGDHGYSYYCRSCTVRNLVSVLAGQMGRDVVDDTGLADKYDFHLRYSGRTVSDNDKDDPTKWPPMMDAIQDQLGLKLDQSKGMVKMLVIDHAEMPTDN